MKLRIALAQRAASPDREANLARALEAMRRAAGEGAGLIVFPELAVDRFFPRTRRSQGDSLPAEPVPGPTTERVAAVAAELEMVTVFNLYEEGREGRRYDSSPVIDADGTLLGATRMLHITQYESFYEQDYYHPGDPRAPVYDTRVGRLGVAICYDRHYPEYMRALGVAGAQVVAIPQAGVEGEWPPGMFEAEVRAAAFQNGYFAALANRVGREGRMHFSGESFVSDPEGRLLAQGRKGEEDLVLADLDLERVAGSTARRLFWRHRRPELYAPMLGLVASPG